MGALPQFPSEIHMNANEQVPFTVYTYEITWQGKPEVGPLGEGVLEEKDNPNGPLRMDKRNDNEDPEPMPMPMPMPTPTPTPKTVPECEKRNQRLFIFLTALVLFPLLLLLLFLL